MSKMDNLRAMREARYAADRAKAEETPKRSPVTPAAPVARRLATRPPTPGRPQAETNPVGRRLATRPAGAGQQAPTPPAAPRQAARPGASGPAPVSPTPSSASEELCGHRNMSGRTCTREKGHAAKSHRYS